MNKADWDYFKAACNAKWSTEYMPRDCQKGSELH